MLTPEAASLPNASNVVVHGQNNFDLIRLFAALVVAVFHTLGWLKIPVSNQFVMAINAFFPGVPIFFVVSGFLITRTYVENNRGLASYFVNRALRLYPALWLQYAFVIVLMTATGGFALSTLLDARFWSWLFTAAFMGSNFWAGALMNYNPFSWDGLYKWYPADVLWTIPVELGFYLLVPLVFSTWLRRRGLTGLVMSIAFVASAGFAIYAGDLLRDHSELNSTGMLHSSPAPYFWLFLVGAATAFYWRTVAPWFESKALWWLLAVGIAGAISWKLTGKYNLPFRTPDALTIVRAILLAGLVIAFAHSWTWLSSWMRGIDLSYGLYLFHLPLPFGLYYAGKTGSPELAVLSLAVAFGLAAASWYLVEKPALMKKATLAKAFQAKLSLA